MELSPDLLTLARERWAVRDYHGVVLLLSDLVAQGPVYADACNLLGLAFALLDRPADALGALDRALELNATYVEAHLNRAVVLNQLGREAEAREALARAGELGSPDGTGFPAVVANVLANKHASLGDDYRAAGALPQAIEQYRRALALRPRFPDIGLSLARALIESGAYPEGDQVLDAVLEQRPYWLEAMLLRGLAAYLQGNLARAREIWEDASARHPEEPRLEIYRSMLSRRERVA